MSSQAFRRIVIVVALVAAPLFVTPIARAQQQAPAGVDNPLSEMNAGAAYDQYQEKQLGDPKAASAYESFLKTKDTDKKIKQGEDFINRYSSDYRAQGVYEQLAQLYYTKQDFADFYSCADRGITLYPNDTTLLSLTGYVIPRQYKPTDPDGSKNLDKAESYEKRALGSIATMKAPSSMSVDQFEAYKKQVLALAHGALGLIYFRQSKFQDSITEMTNATDAAATPDATDYLVLGADYQNLSQFKEAAGAFNHCAKIAGPLQSSCTQYADSSEKQAASAK